eukprot:2740010-Pyramimonas_sp.AAC.1
MRPVFAKLRARSVRGSKQAVSLASRHPCLRAVKSSQALVIIGRCLGRLLLGHIRILLSITSLPV